ncbi:hypothetical protein [Rhodopirellula europaea]|nr:hypothetical protein [Rhodopirellula europaea]
MNTVSAGELRRNLHQTGRETGWTLPNRNNLNGRGENEMLSQAISIPQPSKSPIACVGAGSPSDDFGGANFGNALPLCPTSQPTITFIQTPVSQ